MKSNSFDDPLRDPLRTFVVEGEPNIPRTALFAKTTSSRVQEKSKTKFPTFLIRDFCRSKKQKEAGTNS